MSNLDWIYTKFKSGNGVPVKQAVIKREEFVALIEHLHSLYSYYGLPDEAAKIAEVSNPLYKEDRKNP